MAVFDLHFQFFVVTVCDIEADAANEFIRIERRQYGHGRLLVRQSGPDESSPTNVAVSLRKAQCGADGPRSSES
jgi:hypothetical protein